MPFHQDVEAKLTLTRVATAPVLVAEVAKLTGKKLEVAPSLSTEVLMVSVEGVGAMDVLAKLAVAATAAWQPIEGGYRLVPDAAARSIEASSERARRLFSITDGLKKKQAAEAKQAAAMAAAAKTSGAKVKSDDMGDILLGGMFGGSSVDSFIPMLDLSALANMEVGERIVFATNPNAAQRALRGNPLPIVQKWIGSHNQMAKSMGASPSDAVPEEMAALMSGSLGDRMKRMSQAITVAPAKIVVVASRGVNPLGMFGGGDVGLDVRLEVRAYAANGTLLIEETGSVDTDMMALIAAMTAPKKATDADKTTPIAYSEDAKDLLSSYGDGSSFMGGGFDNGLNLPLSLHKKLFSPDEFEPLALVPGEGLAALAKARRKPLVASIPDAAYPGLQGNVPRTVEDVEASVKSGTMRLVPDTSFLVVRAAEPEAARRNRVDRAALARFMDAVADHEAPTLDELAQFASKTPSPLRNALSMKYLSTFAPTSLSSMSGMVSWDALRLYAALNPVQRGSLASGGRVAFSALTPAAQAALSAMVYGAGGILTVERPGVANETDIFSRGMSMMMGGGGIDARDEPTEVAPRGLPTDGYLQAAVASDALIRPLASDGPVYYALGTDELAMFGLLTSSGIAEAQEAIKLPATGRLGSRTVWNLRGHIASGVYVESTLMDDRTPKSGAQVTLANLPADVQAKIAQKMEKLKKGPFGAMMTIGVGFKDRQQGQP